MASVMAKFTQENTKMSNYVGLQICDFFETPLAIIVISRYL